MSDARRKIINLNRELREGDGLISVGQKRRLETEIINYQAKRLRETQKVRWFNVSSAFKNRVITGVVANISHKDVDEYFEDAFRVVKRRLKSAIKRLDGIKVNFTFSAEFMRKETEEVTMKYFATSNYAAYESTDLHKLYDSAIDSIKNKLSEFHEKGSGWTLKSIQSLSVNICMTASF